MRSSHHSHVSGLPGAAPGAEDSTQQRGGVALPQHLCSYLAWRLRVLVAKPSWHRCRLVVRDPLISSFHQLDTSICSQYPSLKQFQPRLLSTPSRQLFGHDAFPLITLQLLPAPARSSPKHPFIPSDSPNRPAHHIRVAIIVSRNRF